MPRSSVGLCPSSQVWDSLLALRRLVIPAQDSIGRAQFRQSCPWLKFIRPADLLPSGPAKGDTGGLSGISGLHSFRSVTQGTRAASGLPSLSSLPYTGGISIWLVMTVRGLMQSSDPDALAWKKAETTRGGRGWAGTMVIVGQSRSHSK